MADRRAEVLAGIRGLDGVAEGESVFGDGPDAMMVTGASIIVLSGLYAFYRERKRARPVAARASGLPPDGL